MSDHDPADRRKFRAADPTAVLLEGARQGESRALEILLDRYGDRLRRWAAGRLPLYARHTDDTEDLVQDVLVESLRHLESFENRESGAFHSYMRTAILNRIRSRIRHKKVREKAAENIAEQHHQPRSPLEELLGLEATERYEKALASLREADREIIVARMELQCTYEELAGILGKPSANATRMALQRALFRLAQAMSEAETNGDDDGATEVL